MQFRLWAPLITQAKLVREIKDDFIRQATDAGIRAGDAKGLTRSEGLALADAFDLGTLQSFDCDKRSCLVWLQFAFPR
jgi:hypothetical protein